jgi:hypothetical protein
MIGIGRPGAIQVEGGGTGEGQHGRQQGYSGCEDGVAGAGHDDISDGC